MKTIHKLSPEIISQIAAGEVIERPAYAVKELIDNSIDAGATSITITIKDYGLKNITVSDNGTGMSKEDLLDCFKIHTTSKIKSGGNLHSIRSLGFRGEALASIAAVSELTIRSRRQDDLGGYEIYTKENKLISQGPVGMAVGTVVEINHIFSGIPARKKFLKSGLLEFRQILEIFLSFVLSFPNISFKLLHNQKVIYDLPQTLDAKERIGIISHDKILENLIPLSFKDSYLKITGFISKPQINVKSPTRQYLFVNGRRIQDRLISKSLKDAYNTLLDTKSHPLCYLFLEIPFELLDVNIHPRKEQVSFLNSQTVYENIYQVVKDTLNENNLTFNNLKFQREEITDNLTGQILKSKTDIWLPRKKLKIDYAKAMQFHNLYIIVPTDAGFLLFDQHAVHERILFEQFNNQFRKLKKQTIKLSPPIYLNLTVSEKNVLKEFQKKLSRIGLTFDNKQELLTGIPNFFKDRDLNALIHELLEELESDNSLSPIDDISLSIVKYLSCKNAVKAGDKLTTEEMIDLIKKLEKTADNYTCPHGRPTKIEISKNELNRWFKRN